MTLSKSHHRSILEASRASSRDEKNRTGVYLKAINIKASMMIEYMFLVYRK